MASERTALEVAGLDPYQVYRETSTGLVHNTGLLVLEAIRNAHPESHVTACAETEFDILGWAQSGNAQLRLVRDGNLFSAFREFEPPENSVGGDEGTLGEKVMFGLYSLTAQGVEIKVYLIEWPMNFLARTRRTFFLLTDKAGVDGDGHSTAADKLLLAIGNWTSRLHDEIWIFDQGDWNKDSRLWKGIKRSSWDDIILNPTTKKRLLGDVCNFFDSRGSYQQYGIPWKRGIIFHGPPGCGKTMTLKALVNLLDERQGGQIPSLVVKSFDACEGPQYSIKSIFTMARDMAPCLLILEDLDSLVVDKVRSYFLNEVDGLEDNDGILIVGSTNHLERLDIGISKRPSRFDRKYHFKLPSRTERKRYCEHWRAKIDEGSKIDLGDEICDAVAERTEGFSFAYLKELIVQTLLCVARNEETEGQKDDALEGHERQDNFEPADGSHELPEGLKDDVLMRTFARQIAILKRDMQSQGAGGKDPRKDAQASEEED